MDSSDCRRKKVTTFLGRKREGNPLFSSSLFRKLFLNESKAQNESNSKYETVSWRYKHLFSFNWDDKCIKDTLYPLNNLSPAAFWFLINSMYFPSDFQFVKENIDDLTEVLSSFSGDIDKLSIKKTSLLKNRLNLVNELVSLSTYYEKEEEMNNSTGNSSCSAHESISNGPLTFADIESRLCDSIAKVRQFNEGRISELKDRMSIDSCNAGYWSESAGGEDDLLKDMLFNRKHENEYFDYLKRQKKKKIRELCQTDKIFEIEQEISRIKDIDDWVCCVCNNGDHDENQLIFECESCSVTVHQACYGIKALQSVQHWKCDPCSKMPKEEAQKLDCILCRVKGGAMKQVQLPRNCTFVRNILGCRENLSSDLSSSLDDETTSDNVFPKYNSTIIIPLQDYSEMDCAWAHLSCALWNPFVSFGNFDEKTQIGNLEMIEYKQFEEKCSVCNMRNYGPTLHCNSKGCSFKCHPECARMNKYHLEIENDKGTLNYNVYCLEHEPIKLIKSIATRNNLNRQDIEDFDQVLAKIYRSFEKEYKVSLLSVQPQGKLPSSLYEGANRLYSKERLIRKCSVVIGNNSKPFPVNSSSLNSNQKLFLHKLSNLCKVYSQSNRVVLLKHHLNSNHKASNAQVSFSVDFSPQDNLLAYEDLLKTDFPWEQMRFKSYPRQHLRDYLKKLVPDKHSYESLMKAKKQLTTEEEEEERKTVEIIHENGEKTVREAEIDANLYCYCKQKYSPGNMMICCEKGFNCKGSHEGWYHVQCIEETKGMSQNQLDSFKFICMECKKGLNKLD